jgi:hypothetical protein
MAAMSPMKAEALSAGQSHPTRSPSPNGSDLEQKFRELVDRWQADVAPLSSTTARVQHPAHREIIAMGPAVVPFFLRELERRPNHWFAALRTFTGADPVAPAGRGHLGRMAESWIKWGKESGS